MCDGFGRKDGKRRDLATIPALRNTEYICRGRVEIGAGAHTTTLYVMVDIVKGGGRAPSPPPLNRLG